MIFLAVAVLPILRQPGYRSVAVPLIQAAGVRFRWVGWVALATLVVTGAANLRFRDHGWARVRDGNVWQGWFGHTLAAKLILVMAIVIISAVEPPQWVDCVKWADNKPRSVAQCLRRRMLSIISPAAKRFEIYVIGMSDDLTDLLPREPSAG